MKVLTKDFQALKGENTFEFSPGINIIIGPNGSGKSSLFYAIENCLENPNGVDDCINFDSDSTKVTIENNNQSLSWIREKGSSTYVNNLDNSKYVKASKLDSSDICNLGFYFDKKGRVMNIHNEWSVLFPFGESDNDMFRLFEDIFNISCSFNVLDNMKKDEQELKGNLKRLIIDKESQENKLNILNEILTKVNIFDLDNYINDIKDLKSSKETLEQDYEKYKTNYPIKSLVLPGTFDISLVYNAFYTLDELSKVLNKYSTAKVKKDIILPDIQSIDLSFTMDEELVEKYEHYCLLKSSILNYEKEYSELENIKKDISEKISQIKVCPTCGRPLGDK